MREVSGAVVAIVLVLCAVFIPVAFLGGIAGQLYRQFAVTLTFAVVISGFIALTLTPALCAILMKSGHHESRIFRPFNRGFAWITQRFLGGVNLAAAAPAAFAAEFRRRPGSSACSCFCACPRASCRRKTRATSSATIQLPDGATLERTRKAAGELGKIAQSNAGVQNVMVINGFDLLGGGNKTNAATMFIPLKHWDDAQGHAGGGHRRRHRRHAASSCAKAWRSRSTRAAIRGLGTAGGFELYVQARTDPNAQRLFQVDAAAPRRRCASIRSSSASTRSSARPCRSCASKWIARRRLSLGVPVQDVFDALQSTMSALYVNDFNKFGRTYRVQMQADAPFRAQPEDLGAIYVRSATTREMIPLKALIITSNVVGPGAARALQRLRRRARCSATAGRACRSGEAIARWRKPPPGRCPRATRSPGSGQAFQEKRTGRASAIAFSLAIVMVFLILAALYERWLLPFAVVLAVPFAVAGALALRLDARAWRTTSTSRSAWWC